MKPVKLQDIIDELEIQADVSRIFLNTETGGIISLPTEELSIAEEAEEGDDFSQYPEWQRCLILDALDVVTNLHSGKYIKLPDQWDINEYEIMEAFCGTVEGDEISDALYSAIQGRGAFRRFKDTVYQYNLEDAWYKFRYEALKKLAIEWCEANNIPYIDVVK